MSKADPILVKVKKTGLSTDFVLTKTGFSGLSVDYQETKGAELDKLMSLVNDILNSPLPGGRNAMPALVEGLAQLSQRPDAPAPKEPTILNVKTSGFNLDLLIRNGKVMSANLDYQKSSGGVDIKAIVGMMNNICTAAANGGAGVFLPTGQAMRLNGSPLQNQEEDQALGPLLTPQQGKVITEAVNRVLEQIGTDGRQVVLSLLQSRYGLRLEDVPNHPRAFVEILALHVGSAAHILERDIISDIGRSFPVSGKTLQAAVRSLEDSNSPKLLGQAGPKAPEAPKTVQSEAPKSAPNEAKPAEVAAQVPKEEAPVVQAEPVDQLKDLPTVALSWNTKRK